MEIKTLRQLIKKYEGVIEEIEMNPWILKDKEKVKEWFNEAFRKKLNDYQNKKWVAVDELIKEIEILKDRFGARPKADKGEKQDRFISYLDLLNSLSNENKKEHYNIGLRSPINEKLKEDDKDVK